MSSENFKNTSEWSAKQETDIIELRRMVRPIKLRSDFQKNRKETYEQAFFDVETPGDFGKRSVEFLKKIDTWRKVEPKNDAELQQAIQQLKEIQHTAELMKKNAEEGTLEKLKGIHIYETATNAIEDILRGINKNERREYNDMAEALNQIVRLHAKNPNARSEYDNILFDMALLKKELNNAKPNLNGNTYKKAGGELKHIENLLRINNIETNPDDYVARYFEISSALKEYKMGINNEIKKIVERANQPKSDEKENFIHKQKSDERKRPSPL